MINGTACRHRIVEDYLEDHKVVCGSGAKEYVQNHLLVINPITLPVEDTPFMQAGPSLEYIVLSNTAKKDFLKDFGQNEDQYSRLCQRPILSTVMP